MKKYVYRLQHYLSRSKWWVNFLIKLRNQCNIIVGLSLAPDHIFEKSGEADFLKSTKGNVKLFFDIGANMGEWTEEMLQLNPDAKGILLEPNPDCLQSLQNKFKQLTNIEIMECACADISGKAVFFAEHGGGETSSLSGAGSYGARPIEVSVITIDEIVAKYEIKHIDYLKIDVEGFDLHVLKGAKDTLQKGLVDIIQFEYNRTWRQNGSTLTFAINYLDNLGYKTFSLQKAGLVDFDVDRYMEYFAYSNFISLKQITNRK